MSTRAILLAFALTLTAIEHLAAQEQIAPFGRRIVGGERTDIKHHPWQVALNISVGNEILLCGGSIIGQRWVLTAAHCFPQAAKATGVRAKAGVTNYALAGTWSVIEQVIVHEAYNPKTFENDIALIKLKSPLAGRVIPLASAGTIIPIGAALEVTGWGATGEGGDASRVLQKGNVPNADTSACNAADAYNGQIKAGMMCAGYRDGGVDSCQGDSGGPLLWRTSDGPILVGVVSWGEGCARKLRFGVYTRVSAYRDWIDRVVAVGRQ
jgi:trypsin